MKDVIALYVGWVKYNVEQLTWFQIRLATPWTHIIPMLFKQGQHVLATYPSHHVLVPLIKTSFTGLLSFTFVIFLIHWHLSPAASIVSWCQSCFVCSRLTYEIYSGGTPSIYIYCMVCYHAIAARISKNSFHVFVHCFTLDDDS